MLRRTQSRITTIIIPGIVILDMVVATLVTIVHPDRQKKVVVDDLILS